MMWERVGYVSFNLVSVLILINLKINYLNLNLINFKNPEHVILALEGSWVGSFDPVIF